MFPPRGGLNRGPLDHMRANWPDTVTCLGADVCSSGGRPPRTEEDDGTACRDHHLAPRGVPWAGLQTMKLPSNTILFLISYP